MSIHGCTTYIYSHKFVNNTYHSFATVCLFFYVLFIYSLRILLVSRIIMHMYEYTICDAFDFWRYCKKKTISVGNQF